MSLSAHTVGLSALFVGCAVVVAIGCSSSSPKKVHGAGGGTSEGGEAGAPSSAGGSATKPTGGSGGSAGAAVTGEAGQGQGGTTVIGQAGAPSAAGAPSEAGASEGGEPGAAGAGPLACTSSGSVGVVAIPEQAVQTVCRGAVADANYTAQNTGSSFTCCGALDASTSFTVNGLGDDGGGLVSFVVPSDAPAGNQSVSLVCSAGAVSGNINLNVTDTLPPVVTGLANSVIYNGNGVEIDGSNLSGVTSVTAVATGNPNDKTDCTIDSEDSTDSVILCGFDSGISNGDFYIVVEQDDCGAAVNAPSLTILASL